MSNVLHALLSVSALTPISFRRPLASGAHSFADPHIRRRRMVSRDYTLTLIS
ncbi:hypothetical protein GCM10011410_01570 [Hoyosella rhizosphaerae]|uniref:Uncharacterized protein n=1 Tax=Hoyosella rhizosphaerae TaxID=1755582 RepID=A0A916TYT1_9ACTN|nr:hypothetical protein GCM10011410_01570 [Hoyosella rhizosphaerae]